MSEILLQAIVEKLEALEIALLKGSKPGKDEKASNELATTVKSIQSEFIKFSSVFYENNEKMNDLSEATNTLRLNIHHLAQNQLRQRKLFKKPVWLTASLLFIGSLLLAYGWINCSNERKSFEANDIKYRYWKADSNASLLRLTYYTDSLYDMDKESFKTQVISAEQQIAEQEKMHRLADEKKKKQENLR